MSYESYNQQFQTVFEQSLGAYCQSKNATPEQLTDTQWYQLIARVSQEFINKYYPYQGSNEKRKVNYLSMEFLIGRLLGNNLMNLGVYAYVENTLKKHNQTLVDVLESETDPALGNGGLGRLAACYLDSMASLSQPAIGYGLHYQYGLFKQSFAENGEQLETGDYWNRDYYAQQYHLPEARQTVGFVGSVTKTDDNIYDWQPDWTIYGEAFDVPIVGYKGIQQPLRLWQGKNEAGINFTDFNDGKYLEAHKDTIKAERLTEILYPNDNHKEGKELRLMQQYFHCACSIGDIIRQHLLQGRDLKQLGDYEVIQLNDTHPALAIPELMRVLIDTYRFSWESAWAVCQQTFAYTNHTLLPEALEQWDMDLVKQLLPRHFIIIEQINENLKQQAKATFTDNDFSAIWEKISLIYDNKVRMANLSVVGSFAVNGVAQIHSSLVKTELFPEYAQLFPNRFHNVTNGITPRRWIGQANPALTALLDKHIDGDWLKDLSLLKQLEPLANDKAFQDSYYQIKQQNKQALVDKIKADLGLSVNCEAIFDVQIKRFHEYKRQHLNLLNIIAMYQELKANPDQPFVPRVFIFAGKAAPGYFMAKQIIQAINAIAKVINNDPEMKDKLQVVFLPNYQVSLAERIIPAADVSQQISLAGKEASGTGNMKLALNGAITLGTLDGANIEIADYAGEENVVIFGHTVDSIREVCEAGYRSRDYYEKNPILRQAIDALTDGTFTDGDKKTFAPLVDNLLNDDYFCVLADFDSYYHAQKEIAKRYQDKMAWTKSAILNTARLGSFSSDRSIVDYQENIWKR